MIAVPLNNRDGLASTVCEHFGSAPYYALFHPETQQLEIVDNPNSEHVHGQCRPADVFTGNGVQAVICNGIGGRAASKLHAHGVEIYIAGMAATAGEALERYTSGKARKMDARSVCGGHECH
ncbi:NifB/NifX family molybdenum-iron cluster-binding protein [Prosthecochloris sp. N3]|uniref:NifB/NifX family molybdenum-iron cluster-binding protein n=1 Tax=Prosthecochloris ethylica TaxID=2743976 RepID=A0ABR9XQF9_9CHLB|nr:MULTISPECIES: NifB/NifX family molybdenum-iron cluster-binding protein [Prosthecochloris]MEC9487849.1 NifB/NifX family molybdenum-iron cluster-binding protein [Prosthecochloris sp.]MBF0585428.1 NifB/NifX family molybdenum-iron cluster-binding protein [Prosthecochloris ethylica]MBF0636214.1 NifB/NifX family molybdenum-iron cluster-binding protein [Prosthecochloris ethylica]NUK46658.1 dinitrogenase iron-molybdenum cofactor biosynthesis protein [Prosthecochloris ethylica]RNA64740.1 dinitrogena